MAARTGSDRSRRRDQQRPTDRKSASRDQHEPFVVRMMFLVGLAGLGAVLALTAMAVTTGNETTATVAVSAVGAIVSAAIGAGVAYLRRHR